MAASLGATTFTSVVWTFGDVITEAKMDNMTANDQAYDSHASQGYLADNDKSFAGENNAGGTNINIAKINTSDEIEIGQNDTHRKTYGSFQDAVTATDQATVEFDLAKGNTHIVTLGGNRTLSLTNEKVGQWFVVELLQDGSGSHTVTWFSTIKWAGGSEPTLTTTANKKDTFLLRVTSAGNYDGYTVGSNVG